MNKKMNSTQTDALHGRIRFRRTVLFAAIMQAMLPVLTACGDMADTGTSSPAVQKAQATQKSSARPGEHAPRSPFRVDRVTDDMHPSPAPVTTDDLPSLGTDPVSQTGGGAGDELKSARQSVRLAQEHRDAQQDGAATLASAASTAGSLLKGPHPGQAAASMAEGMARGMALGKANQTVQDWLSHFGNARVQLNADSDFSLKSSALDLLHPWWETPDNMLFSQASLHRTNDRNQANLGFGWRHWAKGSAPRGLFHGNYMTGLNAFLDYDLSRDHARMGVGAEFWRDYLKMDANLYHRLTNWKNSPDLEDYEERPADGWDLRMQGWLPTYPQLGAKLDYEQYYGNQVALFDTDHLQKDPRALTAGLTWTPFPLMTVSAGRRQGQNSHFETEIGVNFTLNPDLTWQQQTDPSAVAAMRTLAGSRHDFVERNNNIVLEYRKKTVIAIALPERVEGKSGMQYPLDVTVSKAKYGLQDIVWDDAAFLAAGGKLTCTGSTACTITMPPFHPGAQNTWTVGAVAHDRKGNTSERAQTTIAVTGVGVSASDSALTLASVDLLADGRSADVVTATLKSADGQPATGLADQLTLSGVLTPDHQVVDVKAGMRARVSAPAVSAPTLSALREDGARPGTYTGTLKAGTTAGKYALTLNLNNAPLLTTNVTLTDTMADISKSTLTADKTTVTASNGSDPANVVHFTVTLADKAGKPVSHEAGRLKLATTRSGVDITRLKFSALREDSAQPGTYTGTLSSTLAVKGLPVTLMINGKDSGKHQTVTVLPDIASARTGLVVTKDNAVANGTDPDTVDMTVSDQFSNPLESQKVTLNAGASDHVNFASTVVTTGADGKGTATLTTLVPGTKTVTSTLSGGATSDIHVTFRGDPSVTVKQLTVTDHNGHTTRERPVGTTDESEFILKATVQNGSGQPVASLPVRWALDQSACADTATTGALSAVTADTDQNGVATVTLTSAGKHRACAKVGVSAVVPGTTAKQDTVAWVAEAASAQVVKNQVTSAYAEYLADGKAHADYTATVTDQYGNPAKDITVTWNGVQTAVFSHAGTTLTDADGHATNSLTSTTVVQGIAPVASVTSSVKGTTTKTADRKVDFVANAGSATVASLTVTDHSGKDATELPVGTTDASTFTATAVVKDSNHNPVSGKAVTWTLDQSACGGTNEASLKVTNTTTDAKGESVAEVTSAAPHHICRGLKLMAATGTAGHQEATLNYIAEEASADVKTVSLATGAKTTYTANGKDAAAWTAAVQDQYGNVVPNETVSWGGVTGSQPAWATATTTTDAGGLAQNTMTSTVSATNVKAAAQVHSATHTGSTVTAQTGVTFVADVTSVTLSATTAGDRQPTETDTSKTAATADGTDTLQVTWKAVDAHGNAVADAVVKYAKADTSLGITAGETACTMAQAGTCTATLKTAKAATYTVEAGLWPRGSSASVATGKATAVFLAGQPDPAHTTISTDKTAADADMNETITVKIAPRDSHDNVVPLWTFSKALSITPSVNATVPGAVTVSTPTADPTTGEVQSELRYVDTSGKLLSKEARGGKTTVAVSGKTLGTTDTRFYPDVHICLENLSDGYIIPGKTEVRLCDDTGHPVPPGSAYTVTATGLSAGACPAAGGGVCPSDSNGVKADFSYLNGDDIDALRNNRATYTIRDTVSGAATISSGIGKAKMAVFLVAAPHHPAADIGATSDPFHVADAQKYCKDAYYRAFEKYADIGPALRATLSTDVGIGGPLTRPGGPWSTVYAGNVGKIQTTGGDTNPEMYTVPVSDGSHAERETYWYTRTEGSVTGLLTQGKGALEPPALVFVNGNRHEATYALADDYVATWGGIEGTTNLSFGNNIGRAASNWNVSDVMYINNWTGAPYTAHKNDGNSSYPYVTRVNYVTGYVCVADLS